MVNLSMLSTPRSLSVVPARESIAWFRFSGTGYMLDEAGVLATVVSPESTPVNGNSGNNWGAVVSLSFCLSVLSLFCELFL
ncbi:hypothetical protein J9J44_004203, partial [Salmonella enterica]|nr:hypothetical protein [Salmonella enterica]